MNVIPSNVKYVSGDNTDINPQKTKKRNCNNLTIELVRYWMYEEATKTALDCIYFNRRYFDILYSSLSWTYPQCMKV